MPPLTEAQFEELYSAGQIAPADSPQMGQSYGMMDATGQTYPLPSNIVKTPMPNSISDQQFEELYQAGQQPQEGFWPTVKKELNDFGTAASDFASFSTADELSRVENYLAAKLAGRPDAYEQGLAEQDRIRQNQKQLMEENPLKYMGSGAVGGLLSALMTGGASAKPQAASFAAKLWPAIKTGAKFGGLYGFGSGEGGLENRAWNAAGGAAGGAALGPVVQAGASGLGTLAGALAKSDIVREAGAGARAFLGNDAGALLPRSVVPPSAQLSKAESVLARKLSGLPVSQVQSGLQELKQAKGNSPLWLAEALGQDNTAGSPEMLRFSRNIANTPGGMDPAQMAIRNRLEGGAGRMRDILKEVSPDGGGLSSAQNFTEGAAQIVKDARLKRTNLTKGIYKEAFEQSPIVKGPEINEVIQKPFMQEAIAQVRKEYPNFADLPDNSLQVVHEARQVLDEIRSKALAEGSGRKANFIKETKNALDEVLMGNQEKGISPRVPAYQEATEIYAKASRLVNRLEGNKWGKDKTFKLLKGLTDGDPEQAVAAARKLMDMRPETIRKIRGIFGTKYREEFRAGVTAMIDDDLQRHSISDVAKKWVMPDALKRDQLKAALGPELFPKIEEKLIREHKIHMAGTSYHAGSSSQGNFQEAADYSNDLGAVEAGASLATNPSPQNITSKIVGGLGKIFSSPPDRATAEQLAQALFNTEGGINALEKVLPVLQRNATIDQAINTGIGAVTKAATRPTINAAIGSTRPPSRSPKGTTGTSLSKALGTNGTNGTSKLPAVVGTVGLADALNQGKPMNIFPPMDYKAPMVTQEPQGQGVKPMLPDSPDEIASIKEAIRKVETGSLTNPELRKSNAKEPAEGVFQVKPSTGKVLHERMGIKESYDSTNVKQQSKIVEYHLKDLMKKYGDVKLVAAAYQMGETRLNKLIKAYGKDWSKIEKNLQPDSAWQLEAKAYVPKFLKALG